MNQPTREEFEELKKELKEEVRQLREQITEPIRIDRLEIDRGGTQELLKETNKKLDKIIQTQTDRSERFDTLERGQQELKRNESVHFDTMVKTVEDSAKELKDTLASKEDMAGARADILKIRESQADFRDKLETMATKDDIAELKGLMMQLLQQKPPES